MLNLFKPIHKEINSPLAPETAMRNIALHIDEPKRSLFGSGTGLLCGRVDLVHRTFTLRNKMRGLNRNPAFIQARGDVRHSGSGSLIRFSIHFSRSSLGIMLLMLAVLLGSLLAFALGAGAEDMEVFHGAAWVAGVMAAVYSALFIAVIYLARRREYAVIESYIRRQAQTDLNG